MKKSASLRPTRIFDSNHRTYAENEDHESSAYVFEAQKVINFKSLVMMKRYDGMRDRYQGKSRQRISFYRVLHEKLYQQLIIFGEVILQ